MSDVDDSTELVACIRFLLGKPPLPREPVGIASFRFSLDGERKQTRNEWAIELGVSRQAVDQRFAMLQRRLAAGVPDAYALAIASPHTLAKRKRGPRQPRTANA